MVIQHRNTKARTVRKFIDKQQNRKKEHIAKKLLASKDSVEIEGLNKRKSVKGDYEYHIGDLYFSRR